MSDVLTREEFIDYLARYRCDGSCEYDLNGHDAALRAWVDKFLDANNGRKIITPLIDRNLTKDDCFAVLDRAGIEIPRSYRKGYPNGNCECCPKGGQAYHQNCREDFPDSFAELVQIQDMIGPGSYFLRFRSGPRKGERMSLRELPAGRGDMKSEPDFQCGVLCELAESDIAEPKA